MKHQRHLNRLGVIAALGLTGCGSPTEGNSDQLSQNLWVAASRVWDTNEIAVCWVTSGNSTEKSWVRSAVENSWGEATGIDFTGWGSCPSSLSNFKGIAITGGSQMVVRGGLGQPLDDVSDMELDFRDPIGGWTRCTANNLDRAACIKAVSIHEFGHSLGFPHEHNRPDQVACSAPPQGSTGDSFVTAYDSMSIMNYCGFATKPSLLDLLGAEILYPKPDPPPLACKTGCFNTSDGLLVHSAGTLQDQWSQRGALEWWSGTAPLWRVDGTPYGRSEDFSAGNLASGNNLVSAEDYISYTGKLAIHSSAVENDSAKWAALAMAAL